MFKDLMQKLTERREGLEASAEDGFTLIELMVVLLIMAILLAIAIPTFLGVTGSANDRAAQSNLNTMVTSGKSIYEQNSQVYPLNPTTSTVTPTLATLVAKGEPGLPIGTTTNGAAATSGKLGADTSVAGTGAVYYALANKTNMCWWTADNTGVITDGGTLAAPWTAAAAGTAPGVVTASSVTTSTGVPTLAGMWYGVFNAGTKAGGCDAPNIGAAAYSTAATTPASDGSTGNLSSTGFPASS